MLQGRHPILYGKCKTVVGTAKAVIWAGIDTLTDGLTERIQTKISNSIKIQIWSMKMSRKTIMMKNDPFLKMITQLKMMERGWQSQSTQHDMILSNSMFKNTIKWFDKLRLFHNI